jgi:hypothetical protein
MTDIRLTSRGKILFGLFIAVLAFVTFWALLDAATPAECKVFAAEMSEGCKILIYEH